MTRENREILAMAEAVLAMIRAAELVDPRAERERSEVEAETAEQVRKTRAPLRGEGSLSHKTLSGSEAEALGRKLRMRRGRKAEA